MMNALQKNYIKLYKQTFVPIFVKDNFDTKTLLDGCRLAGVDVIEYTLRREDANKVIPTLKRDYPEFTVFVGSTIDCDMIVEQMKAKAPQLMRIDELAPLVDGFVSMLPYSDETICKYKASHLIIPTAETSGEALRQMRAGATFVKVCGPDFSFSKSLHAAPTFGYCPTFITGGVTPDRMEEAFSCGNVLAAAGFDLMLKGEDPASLTPERVAEKLRYFIETAKAARAKVNPALTDIDKLDFDSFFDALPNYCSVR